MLIVTNGDSAVATLRQGLRGTPAVERGVTFLPWRDVLHEGPVPLGLDASALATRRAAFLAQRSHRDPSSIVHDFHERDSRFHRALSDGEEVLVWLEHDLYDQLQLLQILDRMASTQESGRRTLLCSNDFVAMLEHDQVRRRLPRRTDLSAEQIALGRRGWQAFTAASPEALDELRTRDLGALSFLRDAVERLLAELPDVRSGLSCTERHLLQALAAGIDRPNSLFRAVQERESAPFLGDWSFWNILESLGQGDHPLLQETDGTPWHTPRGLPPEADVLRTQLRLTPHGEAVLAGRADRCDLVPVDRWLGGYHLRPGHLWRWDTDRRRLVAP